MKALDNINKNILIYYILLFGVQIMPILEEICELFNLLTNSAYHIDYHSVAFYLSSLVYMNMLFIINL